MFKILFYLIFICSSTYIQKRFTKQLSETLPAVRPIASALNMFYSHSKDISSMMMMMLTVEPLQ
jgi:hypothetical protein